MRYKSFVKLSVLAFIFGALCLLAWTMWLSSSNAVSSDSNFENRTEGYRLEITHLKQTLERTERLITHERKLAVGLQRELHDAHSQIDEMSRSLTEMQESKAQIKRQLQTLSVSVAKFDRNVADPPPNSTAATISDRAPNLGSAAKYEYIDAKVSPYAPRLETAVQANRAPGEDKNAVNGVVSTLSDVKQKQQTEMAALTSPIEGFNATETSRSPPVVLTDNRTEQSDANALARDAKRQNDKLQTEEAEQTRHIARPKANASLGKKKQPSYQAYRAKKRFRNEQPSLFNRLARQGVFGTGYSVE